MKARRAKVVPPDVRVGSIPANGKNGSVRFPPLAAIQRQNDQCPLRFITNGSAAFNDAVKSCSSPGGVAPTVLVKRPIKGQIKTGASLMNGQKTRSAPFPQAFRDARNLPSPLAWTVLGDRLPSPDKPHRLLLEFQRVPHPNLFVRQLDSTRYPWFCREHRGGQSAATHPPSLITIFEL